MSGGFNRDLLPDWPDYAGRVGLTLTGRGPWLTTACSIHGGSDSMRVNVESGGWVCMACGAKGGDVLSHFMATVDADFVQAARSLGAWVDGGNSPPQPRRLAARDALSVLGLELGVCVVVISDVRAGIVPNDADWRRFLEAAGRVDFVAREATT